MNTKSLKKVLIPILLFVSLLALVFGTIYQSKNVSAESDKIIPATKVMSLDKPGTYNYYYTGSGNMTDFTGFYVDVALNGNLNSSEYYIGSANEITSVCRNAGATDKRNQQIYMYAEIPQHIRTASANGFASIEAKVNVKTLTGVWGALGAKDLADKISVDFMQGAPSTAGTFDYNFSANATTSWGESNSTSYQSVSLSFNSVTSQYVMLKARATHVAGSSIIGAGTGVTTTSLCIQKPSFTISSSDTTAPVVTFPSANWINTDRTMKVTIQDSQAGIKSVVYNGNPVVCELDASTQNGSYTITATQGSAHTFVVTDNVGNSKTYTYTESKIDKTAPAVNLSVSTSEWTNTAKTLTLNVVEELSGIKSVKCNGVEISNNGTVGEYEYVVDKNGEYVFTIVDNAGNSANVSHVESKIDTTAPVPRITIGKYHHVYDIPFTADLTFIESLFKC